MSEQLHTRGAQLGLAPGFIQGLISQFGPLVAQLLISLLESKLKLCVAHPHLASDTAGATWLQQLLVKTLTDYGPQIETWVLSGEATVTDALISTISKNNAVLALLLSGLKNQLVTAEKALTDKALADLIAALQKTS